MNKELQIFILKKISQPMKKSSRKL